MIFFLSVLFWLFEIFRIDFIVIVFLCFFSFSLLGLIFSFRRDRIFSLLSFFCCTILALILFNIWSRLGVSYRFSFIWSFYSCFKIFIIFRASSVFCFRSFNILWLILICNFVNLLNIEIILNCNFVNFRGLK